MRKMKVREGTKRVRRRSKNELDYLRTHLFDFYESVWVYYSSIISHRTSTQLPAFRSAISLSVVISSLLPDLTLCRCGDRATVSVQEERLHGLCPASVAGKG